MADFRSFGYTVKIMMLAPLMTVATLAIWAAAANLMVITERFLLGI